MGVLWASARKGLRVRDLRAAIGLPRERFEDACEYLLANPPLGLAVQRHGDELRLVTAPEVSTSVERHLNVPKAVPLSKAALEQGGAGRRRLPPAHRPLGCRFIRGSASDSALDTLLQRGLVEHNAHHLLVTTRGFLELMSLRELADLPDLGAQTDE